MSLWTPTACPTRLGKRPLGGGPQGWGRVGAVRETQHTLTFGSPSMSPDPGRKKESYSVSCPLFRGRASKPFYSNPTLFLHRKRSMLAVSFSRDLPVGLAEPGAEAERNLLGRGQQDPGALLAYLMIRSCGVAPCRPCLPSGRPSLDPLGTEEKTQSMVPERAAALYAHLVGSQAQLQQSPALGSFRCGGAPLSHTLKAEQWTFRWVSLFGY